MKTAKAVSEWSNTTWVKPGDEVICMDRRWGREMGDKVVGHGVNRENPDAIPWLVVGARGIVLEVKEGYPRHRCPDHDFRHGDCTCGDDGWVPESASWAKVEWEMSDGTRWAGRLIERQGEGITWERA